MKTREELIESLEAWADVIAEDLMDRAAPSWLRIAWQYQLTTLRRAIELLAENNQ